MKVCFNLQSENPLKHALMPGEYPWTEYIVEDDYPCPAGFQELPLEQYQALKASIDISAFEAVIKPPLPTLLALRLQRRGTSAKRSLRTSQSET
jgi:hypothetical protein